MSGDSENNRDLLSLNEVREQIEPSAGAEVPDDGAPAPVKSTKSRSFIDDADSLMASIRAAVQDDISSEATRLETERQQQEDELRRQEEAAEQSRREQIEARLAAEAARREAAAQDRQARRDAIDLEQRRARGEIIEPEPEKAPVELAIDTPQVAQPPSEPERRGSGLYLAIVGIPLVALVGIGLYLLMQPGEPLNQGALDPVAPKVMVAKPPPVVAPAVAPDAAVAPIAAGGQADAGLVDPVSDAKKGSGKTTKTVKKERKRRRTASRSKKAKKRKKSKRSRKKKKAKKSDDFDVMGGDDDLPF